MQLHFQHVQAHDHHHHHNYHTVAGITIFCFVLHILQTIKYRKLIYTLRACISRSFYTAPYLFVCKWMVLMTWSTHTNNIQLFWILLCEIYIPDDYYVSKYRFQDKRRTYKYHNTDGPVTRCLCVGRKFPICRCSTQSQNEPTRNKVLRMAGEHL